MALISPEEFKKSKGQTTKKSTSGLISPDEFRKQSAPEPTIPYREAVSTGVVPDIDFRQSPLMQEVTTAPLPLANPLPPPPPKDERGSVQRGLDYVFKENPIARVVNRPFQAAAIASIPDAPMIGPEGNIPGTSARQEFVQRNPLLSSGSETYDKVADIGGNVGSYFLNPAGIGQGPVALYRAADGLAQRYLPKATEGIVKRLPNAGLKLSRDGTRLVDSLAARGVREGAKEALVAGTYAAPRSLLQGDADLRDMAQGTLIEGGLGAATGFAAPFIGGALGGAYRSLRRGSGTNALIDTPSPFDYEGVGLTSPSKDVPTSESIVPSQQQPQAFPRERIETTVDLPPDRGAEEVLDNIQRSESFRNQLQDEIERQFEYLKQSRDTRMGVQQGQIHRDIHGDVVGRTGRISENPQWYQDFYAEHGRTPTDRDLRELAEEHVLRGYREDFTDVPAWRPDDIDRIDAEISDIREVLPFSEGSVKRDLEEALSNLEHQRERYVRILPENVEAPELPGYEAITPERESLLSAISDSLNEQPVSGFSAFARKGEFTNPKDTRSHIVSKTKRDPLSVPKALDEAYARTIDNIQRINDFDKALEATTGTKLSPSDRTYMLAMNSRGSDMISRHILTDSLVDIQGNQIGQSLKDITKKIPKGKEVDFDDYLIAKHAQTRMARGERVYSRESEMTLEKVAEKIADYEKKYPNFQQIADEIYEFDQKVADAWLSSSGLLDPETVAQWRVDNPYWSPNKRFFEAIERPKFQGIRRGFSDQKSPVKKYSPTGSERKIISPIESRIEYVDQYVKAAKRNEVMQALIRNIERNPDELRGWAEIVPTNQADAVNVNAEDGIGEFISKFNDEFSTAVKRGDLTKGNILRGMVNGQPVHVKIHDPALLEALTSLSPQGRNAVVDMVRGVTNTFKVLTTGINPLFSLTRNPFYDITQAYVFSKTIGNTLNPIRQVLDTGRFTWDLMDGVVSVISDAARSSRGADFAPRFLRSFLDARSKLFRDYKAVGGGHSSPIAADRNLLAQSKRSILPQSNVRGLLPRAYSSLENLSNIVESAPRLGEFKRLRKDGDYDSTIKALFEAQDLTVNFKRHGQLSRDVDAFFPYFNAAMQGNDKLVRAFKDQPVATLVKAFTSITIPTLALYALNYNNPAYQKLSNYNKDRFFLFPKKDGTFFRIPKPRELGVPFGSAVERVMREWHEEDPDAFKDFANTVNIVFAPPGIGNLLEGKNPIRDTIAGPLIDVTANRNFADAPIVPGALERLSPRFQYDERTSEPAKWVGDKLNVSPKQIDHLIRSYTGFIGELGIPATTKGASLSDTLMRQITVDPAYSTDATRDFYDLKNKIDTQYADARHTGKIPKGYNDAARLRMNDAASRMSDIRTLSKAIDSSNLSDKEKKDRKRELTEMMNQIARSTYEAVRDATK